MVNYEAIVSIISKISKINDAPCKKTLQKIVFLIEAKHEDLGCDYGIHFYGPYSSDLDFAVRELCDEGTLEIEYTPSEHKISVKSESTIDHHSPVIDEVVDEFAKDTASELELLATALYVYLKDKDVSKIKPDVIKIKGEKYNGSRIDQAIARLKKTGFITG